MTSVICFTQQARRSLNNSAFGTAAYTKARRIGRSIPVLIVTLYLAVFGPLGCVLHCASFVATRPASHANHQLFICKQHGAESGPTLDDATRSPFPTTFIADATLPATLVLPLLLVVLVLLYQHHRAPTRLLFGPLPPPPQPFAR